MSPRTTKRTAPLMAVEVADRLNLARQLIAIADVQLDKARNDLGIARVGLADLEAELLSRGVAS